MTLISLFTTLFISNFLQMLPFALIGSVASQIIGYALPQNFKQILGTHWFLAPIAGILLGVAIPAAKYGSAPVAKNFTNNDFPPSVIMSFICATALINPVSVFSVYAAYGVGTYLFVYLLVGLFVSYLIGLFMTLTNRDSRSEPTLESSNTVLKRSLSAKGRGGMATASRLILKLSSDQFFEIVPYMLVACLIATCVHALVSPVWFIEQVTSYSSAILIFQMLALVFSSETAMNAHMNLFFARLVGLASPFSFLLVGAVLDIKSVVMFTYHTSVKDTSRVVTYLVLLTTLVELVISIYSIVR